jgi:hypothetical protein
VELRDASVAFDEIAMEKAIAQDVALGALLEKDFVVVLDGNKRLGQLKNTAFELLDGGWVLILLLVVAVQSGSALGESEAEAADGGAHQRALGRHRAAVAAHALREDGMVAGDVAVDDGQAALLRAGEAVELLEFE